MTHPRGATPLREETPRAIHPGEETPPVTPPGVATPLVGTLPTTPQEAGIRRPLTILPGGEIKTPPATRPEGAIRPATPLRAWRRLATPQGVGTPPAAPRERGMHQAARLLIKRPVVTVGQREAPQVHWCQEATQW